MQSRRRLKLVVVLLMAAGLAGGVLYWSSQDSLSSEELRLTGRWAGMNDQSTQEFQPNRLYHVKGLAGLGPNVRWRLNNGQLTLSIVASGGRSGIALPESVFKVVNLIPLVNRFVCPRTSELCRFRVRWNGDNEIFLSLVPLGKIGSGVNVGEFGMRRIPEEKR